MSPSVFITQTNDPSKKQVDSIINHIESMNNEQSEEKGDSVTEQKHLQPPKTTEVKEQSPGSAYNTQSNEESLFKKEKFHNYKFSIAPKADDNRPSPTGIISEKI